MNPSGKWVFRNLKLQYINESILAIYEEVYPYFDELDHTNKWYWEARIGLNSRIKNDIYPKGYAATKEQAQKIVESLLEYTETVEF